MSDKKNDEKIVNKKEQKKDWKPIIIYVCIQATSIFGTVLAIAILTAIKMSQAEDFDPETFSASSEALTLGSLIPIICMAVYAVIFIVMYRKRLVEDFKRLTKKQWGLLILAAVAVLGANMGISVLLQSMGVEMSNQDALADSMTALLIPTAIMTALIAPLIEELVFRYSLGSVIKNPIVFVIVSTIIFAALHAMNAAIVVYLVLGLAFSLAYIKTDRNVVASILLHFANNLIGTIGLVLLTLGIE